MKMEFLKEFPHVSDFFEYFKVLARDLTFQICIKMKLDNVIFGIEF
jgi:hypothetical protein